MSLSVDGFVERDLQMKLRRALVGAVCFMLTGGAFADANGNSGNENAAFNAVVNSSATGQGGGVVSSLSAPGSFGAEIGSAVSGLATGAGGIPVAIAAGGNPNVIPPVPEPDAYAMLLAGLGMVVVMARRRSKR